MSPRHHAKDLTDSARATMAKVNEVLDVVDAFTDFGDDPSFHKAQRLIKKLKNSSRSGV